MRQKRLATTIFFFQAGMLGLAALGCGDDDEDDSNFDAAPDTDTDTDAGTDAGTDTDTDSDTDTLQEDFLTWHRIPFAADLDTDADTDTETDTLWDTDLPVPGCGDYSAPGRVWAGADDDVVFLYGGGVFHYDGSELTHYFAGTDSRSGIFALDTEYVWVWGAHTVSGEPYVLRRNGDTWVPEYIELPAEDEIFVLAIWGTSLDDLMLMGMSWGVDPEDYTAVWEYDSGAWVPSTRPIPSYSQMPSLFYRPVDVLSTTPAVFSLGEYGVLEVGDEIVDLYFPGEQAGSIMGTSAQDFRILDDLTLWSRKEGEWTVEMQCPESSCTGWGSAVLHDSGDVYLAGGEGCFGDSEGDWRAHRWDGESMTSILEPEAGGIAAIAASETRIWATAKDAPTSCILMWAEIPADW